jgi:uncharacterized membrane protein
MNQARIPAGYHDAESAALLLRNAVGRTISKRALLAHMREIGWLCVGGDQHNMPRQELKRKGFLTTQERAHCLKGKREIVRTYQVMLLTQKGFQALKMTLQREGSNTMENNAEPKKQENSPPVKPRKFSRIHRTTPTTEKNGVMDFQRADEERKKFMASMAGWCQPLHQGGAKKNGMER